MSKANVTVGMRVGAYRYGSGNFMAEHLFGVVTKVTATGQITVLPEICENGYQRPAVRFGSNDQQLGERYGLYLTLANDLQARLDKENATRALRKAHHELCTVVTSVNRNGYGDIFPDTEWLAEVEVAVAAMKALIK